MLKRGVIEQLVKKYWSKRILSHAYSDIVYASKYSLHGPANKFMSQMGILCSIHNTQS